LTELQAECINNACLYYFKRIEDPYFDSITAKIMVSNLPIIDNENKKLEYIVKHIIQNQPNPMLIGQMFGEATQKIYSQFTDGMVANVSLAIMQNSQWDGMKYFLKEYFLSKHHRVIDI
jgi:hypothetical protein